MLRTLAFTTIVLAALLLEMSSASACMCIDGAGQRALVGWSESGQSALVDHQYTRDCETVAVLEVWQPASRVPRRCFDLQSSAPDTPIECRDAIATCEDCDVELRDSTRARFYTAAPTILPDTELNVELTVPDAEGNQHYKLTLRETGAVLLDVEVNAAAFGTEAEFLEMFRVDVHPTPDGQGALILVHDLLGAFDSPVAMYFPGTAIWAELR